MKVSLFVGDLTEAPAEAICTSTNPRLSLMMGTGGAVRDRGGFEVLRACEEIIEGEFKRSGRREVLFGSAHLTIAGDLPYRGVIHCVASNNQHASSAEGIRVCVRNALAIAEREQFASLAMPVFATGHAHYVFRRAVTAMGEALSENVTAVEEVIVATLQEDRASELIATLAPFFAVTRRER